MNRKTLTIAGGIIALLVLAPLGWWLASPLWRTDVVDEAFPFDLPTVAEAEEMPAEMLAYRFARELPTSRTVEVEQFCS